MDRLTTRIEDKVYYSKGKYEPTTLIAEMVVSEIRECMNKLAEYEDINLTPEQIKELQKQNIYLLEKLEEYEWKYGDVDTAMFYAELQGKC